MYFILFKKSRGIDGKFKVVIVEKKGSFRAPSSMNPTSRHWSQTLKSHFAHIFLSHGRTFLG